MNLPAGGPDERPDPTPTETASPATATDDAPTDTASPATAADDTPTPSSSTIDLERVEHDLAGVEAALRRLDDGTYWTDEVTGAPIPDDVLAADPVARRAATEH